MNALRIWIKAQKIPIIVEQRGKQTAIKINTIVSPFPRFATRAICFSATSIVLNR